jgi:uncharacterized membrane protein
VKREEREGRLTRRIESFSDLVIGFSLALLALTLGIPPHIVDLLTNPWWLVAYFWTFFLIAGLWFNHQRLFTTYFWPEPVAVVLNFVLLSMTGLLVYFVQVFVHYHDSFDRAWAFLAYWAVLGVAFLILGALYAHGTRRRWEQLDSDERYVGLRQAARGLILGPCALLGVAVCMLLRTRGLDDVWPTAVLVSVGVLASRLTAHLLKARIAGA